MTAVPKKRKTLATKIALRSGTGVQSKTS